jgi:hypothetical protein
MIRILIALLLLLSTSQAVDTLSVPTDFNSVTTGTRANLSGNFTAIQTWGNKVRDSIAQVTARMSGYTGSLAVASLSNLRLRLDADNSETARLLVESGTGDSLFTVREDSTAKFYGPLTLNSTLATTGKITSSDSIVATLGLRIGSDTKIYRNGTHMLRMADSLSIDGSLGIGTSAPEFNLDVTKSMAGGTVLGVVRNSDNTSTSSHARLGAYVGGTAGGNPLLLLRILGGSDWSVGVDNIDSDKLKIGPSSSVGTSTALTITTGGAATFSSTVTADSLISAKDFEENTFTVTLTGVSGSVTATARYARIKKQVTLYIPHLVGTSNATTCTITGLPAGITPARTQSFTPFVMNNSSIVTGTALAIQSNGVMQLYISGTSTTFTSSGQKGLYSPSGADGYTFPYTLQ